MNNPKFALISTAFAVSFGLCSAATAETIKNVTPEKLKAACDRAGGSYSPQGRSGTFGCVSADERNMLLCNRSNECTPFHQSRTRQDDRKIAAAFGLSSVAAHP